MLFRSYLRTAWDLKIVPAFLSTPFAQLLFYPAVTLPDALAPGALGAWTLHLPSVSFLGDLRPALCLGAFAGGALGSLWLLLRLKADIFETSLATTARAAEKRLRIRQGRSLVVIPGRQPRSVHLPSSPLFRGIGAIVWKNLVVAGRSRRELVLASVFTLIYTGFLVAIRWVLHRLMAQGGELPARQIMDFDNGIALALCLLVFFLQRTFPFDFRRDGQHLVGFRTLPVSPFALALAEIAVPTAFCLAFQSVGIIALMISGGFEWTLLLVPLLGFPAVALALNGVWNLHYLLAATRRAGGKAGSASPVALVMVVAMSFLIFYPAGWTAVFIGRHTFGSYSEPLAFAGWLTVQYIIDFLLVLTLARLFQHFEVSRDA